MSANAAFDDFVARLGRLQGLPEAAAKECAPLVEEALKRFASAGLDPDGKPWKSKKDGGRPLEHAADAIHTEAKGAKVVTTLEGVEVWHQRSTKSLPKRRVIPDKGEIPPHVAEALELGAARAFETIMGSK